MNPPGVVTLKPAASGKTRKKQWVETFDITMILNTFRFEDENDYQYEIWLKGFSRILKKIDTPKRVIVRFYQKFNAVIFIGGG